MPAAPSLEKRYLTRALNLARQGYGRTSPNPMVGAVVFKGRQVLGEGWHQKAGGAHAEINAIKEARSKGHSLKGSSILVTLEPCSTQGKTPPCCEALIKAGIKSVIIGTLDPNPAHAGRALQVLKKAGLKVRVCRGDAEREASNLNPAFNHWIVERRPWITVKAAMTLDGKIATAQGESKWITGPEARQEAMHVREGSDGILVGINTVLLDNPSLTVRVPGPKEGTTRTLPRGPRRIILDSQARLPLSSKIASDRHADRSLVVVSKRAPKNRRAALEKKVQVLTAPDRNGRLDLNWLTRRLGQENMTSLLVEGGGEINASFLLGGHAHRVMFFYAPMILGGYHAIKTVAGPGAPDLREALSLHDLHWKKIGADLMLQASVKSRTV